MTGKETLLRKIAEASLGTPDDTVREVIFPVVGGEATLKDLVAEYRAKGTEYQRQKRKVFKASYSNHYRRGLIRLLGVLEFRSNNTAHQPVIDALALIVRYAHSTAQYYPLGEHVVLDGAVDPGWADLLTQHRFARAHPGHPPACTRRASFRRCASGCAARRSGSLGAHEWRNPDEDLPTDFETRPRRALRQAPQAAGPRRVHRHAAGRDAHRARRAERRAPRPGLAADHRPQERRDQAHAAGRAARAAEPAAPEESDPRPLGPGPADRHGHRSRAADRDARPAHGRRAPRGARPSGAVGASAAARLRVRHEHRDQRRRRRRARPQRGRPALHRPQALHDRRRPRRRDPARQRDVRRPPTPHLGREHDNRRVRLHALPRL